MATNNSIKLCECGCGNPVSTKYPWRVGRFLRGHALKPRTTHGMKHTRTYKSWDAMKGRCYNPRDRCWDLYGARGIKVCDRWLSFENFIADMGERPFGMSLDRVDNSKNYEPSNCRWATPKTQANNRRNNLILTLNGVSKSASQWAAEAGVSWTAVRYRLKRGWTMERALTEKRCPRS